jgi:hypothetical protein
VTVRKDSTESAPEPHFTRCRQVIVTGRKAARGRPLAPAEKEANKLVSRERTANEDGFADLKNWRILTKVRMNARHATLSRALLVLTRAEITR